MNDYISREAVMNITAETGSWETQNRVRELPPADVQPVDRWISVEDRLPVIDEQVMVYIRNPYDRHNNIELAYLSDESDDEFPYWILDDNSRFYSTRFRYVTHWQPLPEPPKEG